MPTADGCLNLPPLVALGMLHQSCFREQFGALKGMLLSPLRTVALLTLQESQRDCVPLTQTLAAACLFAACLFEWRLLMNWAIAGSIQIRHLGFVRRMVLTLTLDRAESSP